ncbi:MAG: arginine--tRNA ligase [Candidatus Omnitrophica bacterium]|nr:arginine--tRNA ligase [Candidatus Omnitrophota bacterium]
MKSKVEKLISSTLGEICLALKAELPKDFSFEIDIPRNPGHGDLAVNLAFKLSKIVRRNPLEIAQSCATILRRRLNESPEFTDAFRAIEIEAPGFINFFFEPAGLADSLIEIKRSEKTYGSSKPAVKKKVIVEYVSANPTGPLTIAHGRQAALGDSLARIFSFAGYDVYSEFYLNDLGRQIEILGKSVYARYAELCGGKAVFPEDGYKGEYVMELAEELKAKHGKSLLDREDAVSFCADWAAKTILNGIKLDLASVDAHFDNFFSEKSLRQSGKIEKVLDLLKKKDLIYESEGAVWFRSTKLGDDKDRVVRKSTGDYTYLAPDIAYHKDKFDRGYEVIVNLWGPDHHGYVPRLKAACEALGFEKDDIHILIVQLTTLYRKGEPVRMSTRAGEFVTLRELLDEVGPDATRFFFLMRKTDSHLDFDLELAKQKSMDNPVYYLQYAHARISSIVRHSEMALTDKADTNLIREKEELVLVKKLNDFPHIVKQAADSLEPYRVIDYLRDLAATFHQYYHIHRVVTKDEALTRSRLLLIDCVRIVLRNGLMLLGVSQPEKM